MNQYINTNLATATLMHEQATKYYQEVAKGFMNGATKRPLGVASTNFLNAYAEVLQILNKLQKFSPGTGHNDIIARIHFAMSMERVTRHQFNKEQPHYMWHTGQEMKQPVRVLDIDFEKEDGRKVFFFRLENDKFYDSSPAPYRQYSTESMETYLATDLKNVPQDWEMELRKANETSGTYFPTLTYKRKISQEEVTKEMISEAKNVVSLFG